MRHSQCHAEPLSGPASMPDHVAQLFTGVEQLPPAYAVCPTGRYEGPSGNALTGGKAGDAGGSELACRTAIALFTPVSARAYAFWPALLALACRALELVR